jgi:ribose 5-phosphate isomerase B
MKIYLGSDHTGIALKKIVNEFLEKKGYAIEDCGAYVFDADDDYPDFIGKVAQGVSKDPENTKGIVFGGSGQGEAMVANKYKGVRCALFYTPCKPVQAIDITGQKSEDPFEMLKLTRIHNDANMLSLSVRFLKEEDILKAVALWLDTPFPNETRHSRRIEKIKRIEVEN